MRLTARERELNAARLQIEAAVAEAIAAELAILWRKIYPRLRRIERTRPLQKAGFIGGTAIWDNFQQRLQAAVLGELQSGAITIQQIQTAYAQLWMEGPVADVESSILAQQVKDHVGEQITHVAQNTRRQVGDIVGEWYNQEGATMGDLVNGLTPLFAPKRAMTIAATETTRLAALTTDAEMEALGTDEWTWNTKRDELVCHICGDRHGKRFKRGDPMPPAHPNCRCSVIPFVKITPKAVKAPAPVTAPAPEPEPEKPFYPHVGLYGGWKERAKVKHLTAGQVKAWKDFSIKTWGKVQPWITAQEKGELYAEPPKVPVVKKPKPVAQPQPKKARYAPLTETALKAVDLHQVHPSWKNPRGDVRYGAVLINDAGQVLLREPKGHYGGYAWTYAKGGPDFSGEHPVDVARREVLQETGYEMEIVGLVPGGFEGDTSTTYFFVARPKAHHPEKMDTETAQVQWADPQSAPALIAQSVSEKGKKRDTAILAAALEENKKIEAGKANYSHILHPPQPKPKAQPKPYVPNAPLVDVFAPRAGFPESVSGVRVVSTLGGSTGAQLVEAGDGARFVMKRGNSPAHLLEEAYTDAVYQAAGANVPEFRVYQTDNGPVKLSRYVDNAISADKALNGPRAEEVRQQLRQDFALDALLGNWDVLGMSADNVVVDQAGKVYRIDNGGGLRRRGMGQEKKDAWNPHPIELFTMRDRARQGDDPKVEGAQAQAVRVFGGMSYSEVGAQLRAVAGKRDAILAAVPDEVRGVLAARLDTAERLGRAQEQMQSAGWSEGYQEAVGRQIVEMRKAGITERLPRRLEKQPGYESFLLKDENGQVFDHLRGGQSILARVVGRVNAAGGNFDFIRNWLGKQGGSSFNDEPVAVKWLVAQENGGLDDYWWGEGHHHHSRDAALKRAKDAFDSVCQKYGGEEVVRRSLQAYHAFIYELVNAVDLPNKTADGMIHLYRTESREFIFNVAGIKRKGGKSTVRRGAADSTSIVRPVLNDYVTEMDAPLCDILAVYMVESEPGSNRTCLWGDVENEFVTMIGRKKFTYTGLKRDWHG